MLYYRKILTIYLGSHITPVIRYVDDVSFEKLESSENFCKVHGHSFSTVSFAFLVSEYNSKFCISRVQHIMTTQPIIVI